MQLRQTQNSFSGPKSYQDFLETDLSASPDLQSKNPLETVKTVPVDNIELSITE